MVTKFIKNHDVVFPVYKEDDDKYYVSKDLATRVDKTINSKEITQDEYKQNIIEYYTNNGLGFLFK